MLKTLCVTLAKPLYSFAFRRLKPGVLKFIGPLLIEAIVCSLCQLAVPRALPPWGRGRCSEALSRGRALGSEQASQLSDCKLTRSSLRGIVRNRPHSCVLCCCSLCSPLLASTPCLAGSWYLVGDEMEM